HEAFTALSSTHVNRVHGPVRNAHEVPIPRPRDRVNRESFRPGKLLPKQLATGDLLTSRKICEKVRLKGFTILEVCVVLFIIAVIFVVAVPPAAHLLDEEKLQKPIRELQTFARTARRDAMVEDRSYEVLLLNDSYILRPVQKDTSGTDSRMRYEL